jgi:iron complex transport system ATP-binding protein
MLSDPRLRGDNLSARLSGRIILDGIDIVVRPGEVLGLLGPNGAGKSTLLKALAGLIPCTGTLTLDGQPLAPLSPERRARAIAYLPQGTQAQWPMPAAALVALGRHPHRGRFARLDETDRAAIRRAMVEADVLDLADRPLSTLSGGERARVLLARALAVEAPVLLADEPVAHLDPGHQLAVLDLLRRRAGRGDAVVVVLHDLSLAARSCDRVCLLDHGRRVAEGSPDMVLDDPALERVYGIRVARGNHRGQGFLVPWAVTP